jgi:hypothetical protein
MAAQLDLLNLISDKVNGTSVFIEAFLTGRE